MKLFRGLAVAAVMAVLGTSLTVAEEPKKEEKKKGGIRIQVQPGQARPIQIQPGQVRPIQFQPGQTVLISTDGVEKLKLTDEQKKKYEKIESEFKDKMKEINDKYQDVVKGGERDKIREAGQKRQADTEKQRGDSLSKVEAVLTDEQKKTFEEVKKQPVRRPGGGIAPGFPGRGQTPPVGDVLSKPAQEKLQLTDDQKKKVEELQKELETKLQKILTDEQQKQLEELKKEPVRPGIRPLNPQPRPANPR